MTLWGTMAVKKCPLNYKRFECCLCRPPCSSDQSLETQNTKVLDCTATSCQPITHPSTTRYWPVKRTNPGCRAMTSQISIMRSARLDIRGWAKPGASTNALGIFTMLETSPGLKRSSILECRSYGCWAIQRIEK
jgi:hypothetical protein